MHKALGKDLDGSSIGSRLFDPVCSFQFIPSGATALNGRRSLTQPGSVQRARTRQSPPPPLSHLRNRRNTSFMCIAHWYSPSQSVGRITWKLHPGSVGDARSSTGRLSERTHLRGGGRGRTQNSRAPSGSLSRQPGEDVAALLLGEAAPHAAHDENTTRLDTERAKSQTRTPLPCLATPPTRHGDNNNLRGCYSEIAPRAQRRTKKNAKTQTTERTPYTPEQEAKKDAGFCTLVRSISELVHKGSRCTRTGETVSDQSDHRLSRRWNKQE